MSGDSKPPWGSDDEFDAKKAWDLIQNLRGEVKTVKEELSTAKSKITSVEGERDAALKTIKESKESGQSESEKLAAQLADLEKKLADSDHARLRAEVVAEKGLTPAQAKRLSGTTREELEADAADLLEAFPAPSGPGAPPSQRPQSTGGSGHFAGGSDPATPAEEKVDPAKLADSIPLP